MQECDVGKDSILKINATTYLLCQRTPEILSKVYGSNGIWLQWTCEKGGLFDFVSCKPLLHKIYEELKQMLHDLVFCNEARWIVGDEEQKAKYKLSCEVDKAPLISDAHNATRYYECELDNPGDKCGHWSAHTCGNGETFNSTLQQCIAGAKIRSHESRMGLMMAPPMPAYGGYLYPYDLAAYAAAYYGYPPVVGAMPVQSPALPAPVPTSVPMDALQQYYASMYPWLFPNVMGKPVVAATGSGQTQGGTGGSQTSGGASGGQTGGGILPDKSKLPGLNKLPSLGGGGGIGGLSKLPGIG
ncbi:CBM 14 domain containing protein [Trichuris trichiura]|uniref:CBM 14 domain containing protein n=1 Tax=Trichuris trichiura TaxID=36087 RepID=A0A077Z454_TRITR|nr:CBM 14 domain containing protein [Trichuris trichiura]